MHDPALQGALPSQSTGRSMACDAALKTEKRGLGDISLARYCPTWACMWPGGKRALLRSGWRGLQVRHCCKRRRRCRCATRAAWQELASQRLRGYRPCHVVHVSGNGDQSSAPPAQASYVRALWRVAY